MTKNKHPNVMHQGYSDPRPRDYMPIGSAYDEATGMEYRTYGTPNLMILEASHDAVGLCTYWTARKLSDLLAFAGITETHERY